MQPPIGGPRFWRRLVSRWWHPALRMQREWEQRAQADAFGYIGRGYAETDAAFWLSGPVDLQRLILPGVQLAPDAEALEIGCGIGRLLRPLAGRIGQVHGVDIAPGMIGRGRQLLADLPNVRLQVTDGSLAMFADRSLDFVFSFVVFQHIPSKRAIGRYIAEAARVLRPGGVFKFQVDGRARPFWRGSDTWLGVWFQPREIRRLLDAAGLALVDSWGESTQYYWITAQKTPAEAAANARARAAAPQWNPAGLAALLRRLGAAESEGPAIVAGRRALRELAAGFLRRQNGAPPGDFVRTAFAAVLDREPDPAGLAFYSRQLQAGASRPYVLDCLLSSAELHDLVRRVRVP
ncbi:MAG: methyltransferase domain-containing protein [Opitutales bacterium]